MVLGDGSSRVAEMVLGHDPAQVAVTVLGIRHSY